MTEKKIHATVSGRSGRRTRAMLIGLMLIQAMGLTACSNNRGDERAMLAEENESLRARLQEQERALDMANEQIRERELRLAEARRAAEEARSAAASAPVANDPFGGIAGVRGSVSGGEVRAIVEGDVLFASGQATLRNEAKRTLDQVARVIQTQFPGRTIRVLGHTDSDPIRKSGFETNHHLGFARAMAVRAYLLQKGLQGAQIYVASFGPDRPMSSKPQSRRVEIAVALGD